MPTLPRGLILLASLWLFLSWIGSMGIHPPLLVATSSYTPSVRLMLLASAVGALVAWPLLRLCASTHRSPIIAAWLDLAVVLGMLNMVIWPLRLVTPWPVTRMAVLMLVVDLWIVAVGAIVSIGIGSGRGAIRTAAMIVVMAVSLGAIAARGAGIPGLAPFPSPLGGPIEAILSMTTSGGAPPTRVEVASLQIALAAALAAWSAALLASLLRRRGVHGGERLPPGGAPDTLAAWN